MDHKKELDMMQLDSISGGVLTEYDKTFLRNCITQARQNGITLDEMLAGIDDSEVQEYIKTHW